jgi:hypothetical protein
VLTLYNILTNIAYKEIFPVFSYVSVTGFSFYCVFCALIRDAIVLNGIVCFATFVFSSLSSLTRGTVASMMREGDEL